MGNQSEPWRVDCKKTPMGKMEGKGADERDATDKKRALRQKKKDKRQRKKAKESREKVKC